MNSDHGYGAFHSDGIEPDPSPIHEAGDVRGWQRLTPEQTVRNNAWAERWAAEIGGKMAAAQEAIRRGK